MAYSLFWSTKVNILGLLESGCAAPAVPETIAFHMLLTTRLINYYLKLSFPLLSAPSLAVWSAYCTETNVRGGCRQGRTRSATAVPVDSPEGSHSCGPPFSQERGASTPGRDLQPTAIETGRGHCRGLVVGIHGVPTRLPGPESALSEGSASVAAAQDWKGHHTGSDSCRG